ncbi:MAG TPA: hypothetical protein VIJ57_04935 [Hanamia sp.]
MKNRLAFILLALFLITLTTSECKKNKPVNIIDQLPPETQTGAGTFGCLINNGIAVASYPTGANATYIYTSYSGYSLQITGKVKNKWYVFVQTDSLKVEEKMTYHFCDYYTKGSARAICILNSNDHFSKCSLNGQLLINHLDSIKQIVSGTFWFDATDTVTNDLVHITNGRFDLHYTR